MSSRIARARVVQGDPAEGAVVLEWPAVGEPMPLVWTTGAAATGGMGGVPGSGAMGHALGGSKGSGSMGAGLGHAAGGSMGSRTFAAGGTPGASPPACNCQEEIESIRRQMEAAVGDARLSGQAEGVRQGEQRGRQAAAAEVEPVMTRLLRTIEDLSATRDAFRREAEEDTVRLALGIARRVVHREVTIDGTVLLGVIRAALDKIGARELHRVLVSPQDQPVLAAGIESLRLPRRIDVVADANLERGAVLFETVRGSLDASLETQLDEIERGLIDALDRRPG